MIEVLNQLKNRRNYMKKLYTACLSLVIFCSLLVGVVAADSQTQPTTMFNLPSYSQTQPITMFELPSDVHTQPPTTTTTTTTETTTTPTTDATILSGLPSSLQAVFNFT
jgi:hypothetical protein